MFRFSRVALYLRGINARVHQLFALVRNQVILVECKFFGVLQVWPPLCVAVGFDYARHNKKARFEFRSKLTNRAA